MEQTKKCGRCGEIKRADLFYVNKTKYKDRLVSYLKPMCKECFISDVTEQRRKRREKIRKENKLVKEVIEKGKKRCKQCNEIKSVSDFNICQTDMVGKVIYYRGVCKSCYNNNKREVSAERRKNRILPTKLCVVCKNSFTVGVHKTRTLCCSSECRKKYTAKKAMSFYWKNRKRIVLSQRKRRDKKRKRGKVVCSNCGALFIRKKHKTHLHSVLCSNCSKYSNRGQYIEKYCKKHEVTRHILRRTTGRYICVKCRTFSCNKTKEKNPKLYRAIAKRTWLKYRKKRIKEGIAWAKKRWHNNLQYRLRMGLAHRIRESLKRKVAGKMARKCGGTLSLLGCSLDFLIKHIESKFSKGMSWNNYGKWHIDHIIPCGNYQLQFEEQQKKCFNYTNLQPLWAKDNLAKRDRLDWKAAV